MKKIIFIVFTVLIIQKIHSADTLYYSILKSSIDLAYKDYKLENFRQLANCSERISLVCTNEWLPYYYEAYAYINMSFIATDEDAREMYCDKAQNIIHVAMKIESGESELYVIQSMLYYARMTISPMLSGPLYFQKAINALEVAQKLNADNPRIYYLRGKSLMNTPEFMGGGKDAAIPVFAKAISLYNHFEKRSIVHPDWGKQDALKLFNECKTENSK